MGSVYVLRCHSFVVGHWIFRHRYSRRGTLPSAASCSDRDDRKLEAVNPRLICSQCLSSLSHLHLCNVNTSIWAPIYSKLCSSGCPLFHMLLGTSCAYLAKARSDIYRVVKDFCKGVRVHRHSRIDARGHSHHQQSWTDLIHEQRAQRSGKY